VQKVFFLLKNCPHVHAGDQRLGGSDGGVREQHIFEIVSAGRKDGGTLVNLRRIKQIKDRQMLDGQHFIHAFDAEPALAIEEVRDMGLLESSLLREPEAG